MLFHCDYAETTIIIIIIMLMSIHGLPCLSSLCSHFLCLIYGNTSVSHLGVNVLRSSLNAEGDPSLISWLDECVPHPVFSAPFEQRDLTVNVGKIVKPPSASWFEQILLTPTPAQLTPGFTKSFPSPITRYDFC